jgi:uncharacterized protein (DUF58 family)
MLPPELITKIRRMHIHSRRQVDSMMAGHYKSVFRGTGMAFEEVRAYVPGDDVKSIDWKVSARMGHPFVKRYREEREQVLMLLVDMSASGKFGTTDHLKIELSVEIAAIMAFSAIRNNDKVGAIFFTDRVEGYIPPKKGAGHVWRLIRQIVGFTPENTGTSISSALHFLGGILPRRAVCLLISDFLDNDFIKPLIIASKKHEMIGVLIFDPGDLSLPAGGFMRTEDFESGKKTILDLSHRPTRQHMASAMRRRYEKTASDLRRADIDCIRISTEQDAADVLATYFRHREKMFRS